MRCFANYSTHCSSLWRSSLASWTFCANPVAPPCRCSLAYNWEGLKFWLWSMREVSLLPCFNCPKKSAGKTLLLAVGIYFTFYRLARGFSLPTLFLTINLALRGAVALLIFLRICSELLAPSAGLKTLSSYCFCLAPIIWASFIFEEKVSLSAGIRSLGWEELELF